MIRFAHAARHELVVDHDVGSHGFGCRYVYLANDVHTIPLFSGIALEISNPGS